MAQFRSTATRLDTLPEQVHPTIISNLPPADRLSIAGLNDYWRSTATHISKYSKVAIIPKSPISGRSRAGFQILFQNHAVFKLQSWSETIDCIRFCSEGADIISIKLVCCNFNDTVDWTNIGDYLRHIKSFTIEECDLNASDISEIVSGTTSLNDATLVAVNVRIEGLPNTVRSLLGRNRSLKHLTLRDFESSYENVILRSSLNSIHLSVPNGFDIYFWYSLLARSKITLHKFCCEFFTADLQRFMRFINLTDLRVANVDIQPMPNVFATPSKFPALQAFTYQHRILPPDSIMHADFGLYIFNQNHRLKVLNTDNYFNQEIRLQQLTFLYPYMDMLVFNFLLRPTIITINTIATMTRLRFLVVRDTPLNLIDDHFLAAMISNLHNLRVLIYKSCHRIFHPYATTTFRITYLADLNPNQLYFVSLPGFNVFEQPNVINALDNRYRDIFLFYEDPFASLYSYSTWEQVTQTFLDNLDNP